MVPDFDRQYVNGQGFYNLPPGVHEATWVEFSEHFGFSRRRRKLLGKMRPMLSHMREVGCKFVKIDGSFVTSKPRPRDFDGTWDPNGVDETKLDPIIEDENKYSMIEKYMGELYRQDTIEGDSGMLFDDFFQTDRYENPKGVVKINLETIS